MVTSGTDPDTEGFVKNPISARHKMAVGEWSSSQNGCWEMELVTKRQLVNLFQNKTAVGNWIS